MEGLKDYIYSPSKGWRIVCNPWTLPTIINVILQPFTYDPSTLRRIINVILQLFEGLHNPSTLWRAINVILQPFEGLCNPSKGWRITHNPSTRRRIIFIILGSFNPSKDYIIFRRVEGLHVILQPFEGLCNHWKGWRITHNPSTRRRITFIILERVEGLHVTLQPFKGL